MRAIVIGAGIGGLSAAVALKKAGIDRQRDPARRGGHLHLA